MVASYQVAAVVDSEPYQGVNTSDCREEARGSLWGIGGGCLGGGDGGGNGIVFELSLMPEPLIGIASDGVASN